MVIGIVNLDKCLKKIKDMSDIDIAPVITEATIKVQASAKDLAPYDTGVLKSSIRRKVFKRPGKNGSPWAYGVVYTSTEYAIYQEYGTVKMIAANGGLGFMRIALKYHQKEIHDNMKKFVKNEIHKISNE